MNTRDNTETIEFFDADAGLVATMPLVDISRAVALLAQWCGIVPDPAAVTTTQQRRSAMHTAYHRKQRGHK